MQTHLDNIKISKPMPPKAKKKWDKLLWAIIGPIIETPSAAGAGDRPPEKVAHQIQIERLITVARDSEMATESEAMWYISCASLDIPPSRDWTDIYMYLTRKFMLSAGTKPKDLPDFLQNQIDLNEMQERDLKHLREWLFKKSFEGMKRKLQKNLK